MITAAKKILILGNGGSGKTTLALQLHRTYKIPVLHLDQIYWTSGYVHADKSEFLTKVHSFCKKKEWIIEGTPMPGLAFRAKSADSIIILDYPIGRCIAGVLKRSFIHCCLRHKDNSGCPAIKVSIKTLRWIADYNKRIRPKIQQYVIKPYGEKVTVISNRRELKIFLENFS